jgi:hypothetical protein
VCAGQLAGRRARLATIVSGEWFHTACRHIDSSDLAIVEGRALHRVCPARDLTP